MTTAATSRREVHPVAYRTSILLAALVAVGVWWGLGLPYSLTNWLLDERQLWWTLFCYAWEVPAAGFLGPVLVPQIWWRRIERQWDAAFAPSEPDPAEVGVVEGMILDYPVRVAGVFFAASVIGYVVGAVQLVVFAQLPPVQAAHVVVLGLVTGLIGALCAFLYLERLLAPLLRDLGRERPTAVPTGRRIPIRVKVFACSFVLMVTTVPLFGTVFWNQGARILEDEAAKRLAMAVAATAERLGRTSDSAPSAEQWRGLTADLGPLHLLDARGRFLTGGPGAATLAGLGFRPELVDEILAGGVGQAVDRTQRPRIVAFASVGSPPRHIVAMVPRSELDRQLRTGLFAAGVVFAATLTLALIGGYLFSVRLSRPLEIVTAAAHRTTGAVERAPEFTAVRTNDEVGELAVALNSMTGRLHDLTDELTRYSGELERRVQEATRELTTLYDATRAVTSTLDEDDVMRLVGQHLSEALEVRDVVVMRYSPHDGSPRAHVVGRGLVALRHDVDLSAWWADGFEPVVRALDALEPEMPGELQRVFRGPQVLCVPLPFKGLLIGAIVATCRAEPNLPLAQALGGQVAVALANLGLFETVQRHERDLLELMERQTQVREDTARDISRELHDGMGQSLTAIKLEIGLLERDAPRLGKTEITERTKRLQSYVSGVIQDVRTMSQLLRPTMLDDLGLVPSIRSHVEGVAARTGLAIELDLPPEPERLPAAIELLLYRVTQEAMTNVTKHAHARRVVVRLESTPARARLSIEDDGVGFDPRSTGGRGIGLLGMRERVAYHGGRIELRSAPGEGTAVRLSVPIEPVARAEAGQA